MGTDLTSAPKPGEPAYLTPARSRSAAQHDSAGILDVVAEQSSAWAATSGGEFGGPNVARVSATEVIGPKSRNR